MRAGAGAGAGATERTHVRGRCSPDSAAVANTAELGHAQHRGMCPEEGRGSSKCRGPRPVRTGDSPTGLEDSRTGDRSRISIETLAGTPGAAPSSLGPVSALPWNRGAVRVAQAVGVAPRGYPTLYRAPPLGRRGPLLWAPREGHGEAHAHARAAGVQHGTRELSSVTEFVAICQGSNRKHKVTPNCEW